MGEEVLVQQRCLAVQLLPVRDAALFPCQHRTSPSTSSSSSTSEDTPTPTNPPLALGHTHTRTHSTDHQDGYLLFLAWQAANAACVWDGELVCAAGAVQYVGHLVGGVVLVGGPLPALAALTHAWSRSLLAAPPGYTLAMLGEVQGWGMVRVPQGQFTPLSEALCWVVHHLTREGGRAEPGAVQSALKTAFPTLIAPDSSHIHATLSSLIRQCKVYYSGSSYGIVHPDTYRPRAAQLPDPVTASHLCSPDNDTIPPPAGSSHAVAQTDLAELITGLALPSDTIITPTFPGKGNKNTGCWVGEGGARGHNSRTASLRLSPARAAALATALASSALTLNTYSAADHSDVTVKGERGSVLSKLLLLPVPGRRRLATCSVQFPPPEWSDPACPTRHLHSVATQTATLTHVSSASWTYQHWTPRSATLPRRLRPPKSASPSPPRPSRSTTPSPKTRQSLDQPPSASRMRSRPQESIRNKHVSPSRHKSGIHRHDMHINDIHKGSTQKNTLVAQSSINHTSGHTSPLYQNMEFHKNLLESPAKKESQTRERGRVTAVKDKKEGEMCEVKQQESHINRVSKNQVPEKTGESTRIMESQHQVIHKKQSKGKKHNFDRLEINNRSSDIIPSEGVCDVSKGNKLPRNSEERLAGQNKEGLTRECERGVERLYDRSTLQLPLGLDLGSGLKGAPKSGKEGKKQEALKEHGKKQEAGQHMNNCRKVVRSPQQLTHGLTTNLLHITKGSSSDLTSRNLGYQEVDKCHKKPCSQTLDQAHLSQTHDSSPDTNIDVIVKGEQKGGLPGEWEGGVKIGGEAAASPEAVSVSTYPSLSELNITFTSLAAQKILAGGSVNSLDTLAEVNMAAKKRNKTPVTNTDFGFL